MTTKEAIALTRQLQEAAWRLEQQYIDNGGEATEETEALEEEKAALAALLTDEGIDALGRWLRSVEDAGAALKAEKEAIARQIDANKRTQERIKVLVGDVLRATGREKVKGTLYSFARYTSDTCKADTAAIKEIYGERVADLLRAGGIPAWVSVSLGGCASKVPEGEPLPDVFTRTVTETSIFTKPRKAGEKDGQEA